MKTSGNDAIDLARGAPNIVVVVRGFLLPNVPSNESVSNQATVRWSSLDNSVAGTPVTDRSVHTAIGDGERTGDTSNPGGALNDYTATSAAATFTVPRASISKTLIGTEIANATNTSTQAVIGELVTYQIVVMVPEGVTTAAQILDTLDNGSADPRLGFVTITNVATTAGLSSSLGSIDATTLNANTTISGNGSVAQFMLGTLTNSDSNNAVPETITITYQAVVLNVINNQSGQTLNNSAVLSVGGPSPYTRAPISAANVTLIEPALTTTKTVSVNGGPFAASITGGDAGDPVSYRIVLQHAAGSQADAYDVTLSDIIPAQITATGFSVTDSSGLITAASFSLAGNTLTTVAGGFDFTKIAGRTITIQVDGNLNTSVGTGLTLTNTASAQWNQPRRRVHRPRWRQLQRRQRAYWGGWAARRGRAERLPLG